MTAGSLPRPGPEALTAKLALGLGCVALVNVVVEGTMAVVAGNPFTPPLATPESRFVLLASGIPRLAQVLGGVGLLTAGCWTLAKDRTRVIVGRSYLVLSVVLLLPLALAIINFGPASTALPPAGLLRIRVQLVRVVLFYLSISVVLWTLGRLLLARARKA